MKFILAAVAAAISFAAAAASLQAPNKAGGTIVITDRVCPKSDKLRYAFTTKEDGTVNNGCWAFIDGMVHVHWIEDDVRVIYPVEIFIPNRRKGDDV